MTFYQAINNNNKSIPLIKSSQRNAVMHDLTCVDVVESLIPSVRKQMRVALASRPALIWPRVNLCRRTCYRDKTAGYIVDFFCTLSMQ